MLSASSVREDAALGSVVALISSDGSGKPAAYSITSDPDAKFSISGDELRLAAPLDHETGRAHSVTIRATNQAGSHSETFTITVVDVSETTAPAVVTISASSVREDAAPGSVVAIISSDGSAPVTFTLTEPPGTIALSTTSVQESAEVGSIVATVSSDQPGLTFTLVS